MFFRAGHQTWRDYEKVCGYSDIKRFQRSECLRRHGWCPIRIVPLRCSFVTAREQLIRKHLCHRFFWLRLHLLYDQLAYKKRCLCWTLHSYQHTRLFAITILHPSYRLLILRIAELTRHRVLYLYHHLVNSDSNALFREQSRYERLAISHSIPNLPILLRVPTFGDLLKTFKMGRWPVINRSRPTQIHLHVTINQEEYSKK